MLLEYSCLLHNSTYDRRTQYVHCACAILPSSPYCRRESVCGTSARHASAEGDGLTSSTPKPSAGADNSLLCTSPRSIDTGTTFVVTKWSPLPPNRNSTHPARRVTPEVAGTLLLSFIVAPIVLHSTAHRPAQSFASNQLQLFFGDHPRSREP